MTGDDLTPKNFLTCFLLEQIALQPIEQQLRLYRSLAADTSDNDLARECRKQASALAEVLRNARQLHLNFRRRNILEGGSAP